MRGHPRNGSRLAAGRPSGRRRVAVAVWDALDHSPGYATLVVLLQRLFGKEAADALRAPFILSDVRGLHALFAEAGIGDPEITTYDGTARFPSIESWMYTDIKGWVLADMLDEAQYQLLLKEAEQVLRPYVTAEGHVVFDMPAHIVTAVKA